MKKSGSLLQQEDRMKVTILGLGRVGLPTALGMAEWGWDVTGADNDAGKIASIQQGCCPFFEPGLEPLLAKHLSSGRFRATDDVEAAIRAGSILFICVGTPQAENGEADLIAIEVLARSIARNLNGYKLIVEKSTVPAVTGQWISMTIQRYAAASPHAGNAGTNGNNGHNGAARNLEFEVASNPEFLQEGKAVQNFLHPDRVVCGVTSERARQILARLYRSQADKLFFTDLNTAELIKHAANAFLATKISFINMVADLCESIGADVTQVARGIGMDPRIGKSFLDAGLGFGGYCLPKDVRAFIHVLEEHNVDARLLQATEQINRSRTERLLKKIRQALWVVQGKTVGILGLAFKAGTDDIRDAPSLRIIHALLASGAALRLYDPEAMPNTRELLPENPPRLTYCSSAYEVAQRADAVLVLTEWREFRQLDLHRLRAAMCVPVLLDGRNIYDPATVREAGFEYISMGRGAVPPLRAAARRPISAFPVSAALRPCERAARVSRAIA